MSETTEENFKIFRIILLPRFEHGTPKYEAEVLHIVPKRSVTNTCCIQKLLNQDVSSVVRLTKWDDAAFVTGYRYDLQLNLFTNKYLKTSLCHKSTVVLAVCNPNCNIYQLYTTLLFHIKTKHVLKIYSLITALFQLRL